MEVEQMMACLLAEIRTTIEELKEEMKTKQAKKCRSGWKLRWA
jgi:hypothetical protein